MRVTNSDLGLLFELDQDARQPHSRIGKRIRLSQQMVNYKSRVFQESGLISGFYPLIDYSRFGYLRFPVFFKIHYSSRERFHSFLEKLSKDGSIVEIIECGGRFDVLLVFSAKNPSSFNKALKDIIFTHTMLKEYSILTSVVSHLFPRKYLTDKPSSAKDLVIGGDRELIPIDETDRKILLELQKNAVSPSLEIARKVGVNPKTVISRIRKLQSLGIIKGFRPALHIQSMNYKVNKILLKFHNITPEKEEELKNFCMGNPNITEFTKLFGQWEAEITAETKTLEEFRNAYVLLRERFEDIIMDTESFPVIKIHKKQFLPQEFFEQ